MPAEQGYYRYPAIRGDQVVFVCEDDLWLLDIGAPRARRLTAGTAAATHPSISPDGETIAFVGREEGPAEVYTIPLGGGQARRLTWHGADTASTAWRPDGSAVVYSSNTGRPFGGDFWLHEVDLEGSLPRTLPLGPATRVAFGPGGAIVLARYGTREPASWKRYRGGTAGLIWIDADGSGEFRPLVQLEGNLHSPCWVGGRVYFLSDHEGIGNVYSCRPDGGDLARHTHHDEYYARNLASDGERLVYHSGADLYLLDPAGESQKLEFGLGSARTQRNRRFVPADRYLDSATLSPDGSRLALTTRGKAMAMGDWEGAVTQYGARDGVRYRLLTWLHDGRLIAVAADEGPEEKVVMFSGDDPSAPAEVAVTGAGRITQIEPAPSGGHVALANHRGELCLLDLETAGLRIVDRSEYGEIGGLAMSPDGGWLAYEFWTSPDTCAIKLCRLDTGETSFATRPVLVDRSPAFDPEGRYLYFIGSRDFDPVYDSLHFDLGFPNGTRPYAICLRADLRSPFSPEPKPPAEKKNDAADQKKDDASEAAPAPVQIDLGGIEDRVRPFPMAEGRYGKVAGAAGKALFLVMPIEGAAGRSVMSLEPEPKGRLVAFTFATQKEETLVEGISDFWMGSDRTSLLYRAGNRLRVLKAAEKPADQPGPAAGRPGRESGWVDLGRVKPSVNPAAEWRQMFREAWRLQREHFWSEDLSGVDWEGAFARYAPLVDRVTTRSELSDLIWELQGELGTSHAYEFGGDYRPGPDYKQGRLGVEWEFDAATGEYRIAAIVRGDAWDPDATSALNAPGLDVRPGDAVLAINGQPVGREASPDELLVNLAGAEVELQVRREGGEARTVTVKCLADDRAARYRDWVDSNRAAVHAATSGRVGYLHIPHMMAGGFGEFHRGFLTEYDRDALIVDVRFNGGGHVSPLLLEKLARKRIGYGFPRWFAPTPYPMHAPAGPLVAIANEQAGSDGDIFSHGFKAMGLGPLVGKRTWGGVVGISPRVALADGSLTTQPEHSFHFDNVGWGIENYGTDPDVEVEYRPQDYARGVDPQLEKAIEIAVAAIAATPPHRPAPMPRPRLTAKPLPPWQPAAIAEESPAPTPAEEAPTA